MKTEWIAAASAHITADNRDILTSELLEKLAQTYDPDFYTARINLEHIQWLARFGDVVDTKFEAENGLDKLFVKLHTNEHLESLNNQDQAVFLSIEVVENFAGTGSPYLVGIALTDSPASVGTGRVAMFNNKEYEIQTYNTDCSLDFTNKPQNKPGLVASLMNKFNKEGECTMNEEQIKQVVAEEFANFTKDADAQADKLSKTLQTTTEQLEQTNKELGDIKKEFATFKEQTDKAVQEFQRPPATGGNDTSKEFTNV